MAVETVRVIWNIKGAVGGKPNPIVYMGPPLDMTGGTPINSGNTLKVWRINESTGAKEYYVPGVGGDFTTLDRGTVPARGRGYVIIAIADFILEYTFPA